MKLSRLLPVPASVLIGRTIVLGMIIAVAMFMQKTQSQTTLKIVYVIACFFVARFLIGFVTGRIFRFVGKLWRGEFR